MDQETRLNEALQSFGQSFGPSLGTTASGELPDGFMDGVWLRAGEMAEAANARRRVALFAAIFVAGLGGGFGTIQTPAPAGPQSHLLFAGADLSPAVLLHVDL